MEQHSKMWVTKYRPTSMDDYIFKNESLKLKVESWINSGYIPHIGLFGPAGTGKTSLINVILNGLYEKGTVDPSDVTYLNMADEGIDAVREKIMESATFAPFGEYKVFVLEEMEVMNHKAQASLKRVLEDNEDNARFILTSNAPEKILPAIISRVQEVRIDTHDKETFLNHVIGILLQEQVDVNDDNIEYIDSLIKQTYPDFRKTLNLLESLVVNNTIIKDNSDVSSTTSYKQMIVDAANNKSFRNMRETIVKSIRDDQIDEFFNFLFNNVNLFTDEPVLAMRIIIAIRDARYKSSFVADRELNLSSLLCEIELMCEGLL